MILRPAKVPSWLRSLWRDEAFNYLPHRDFESFACFVTHDLKECTPIRQKDLIIPKSRERIEWERDFQLYLEGKAPYPFLEKGVV